MSNKPTETQDPDAEPAKGDQPSVISISEADLPLHCPLPSQALWNMHPRVFLALDSDGKASCPYCGSRYQLTK